MEGWIKLYRKFSDWEWFNVSEMVHLFIYLLLNANHEEGNWRGINIKRGQILTGLNSLNEKTGISIRTLRTCLDRLEKTKEIDRQTTNKYSIITICNYESYQGEKLNSDKHNDKQPTSNRQTTDKQTTTNNNEENNKNENNEENKKASKSPNFLDQLLDCFVEEHGSYEIMNRGKERAAISKILEKYKEKYPAANSEETLVGLRVYFKQCINISDIWLMNNMSPSIIVSKFNEINKILRNGNSKKPGATYADIERATRQNFPEQFE
jgi:hypothetical protein